MIGYLLVIALILYYFFDMRDRKRTRYKVVKRGAKASFFGAFIASLMRFLIVFYKRKHKFAPVTNNYTAFRKRFARLNYSNFDIPELKYLGNAKS